MPKRTPRFSHLDAQGRARMVDVGAKPVTARTATASAVVTTKPEVLAAITRGDLPKGDVLGAARLAGIQAAKKTAELIPLCHPLPLDHVEVDLTPSPPAQLLIRAAVRLHARTGAEMEALTAVSVAALTVYDMCKSADRSIVIGPLRLEAKRGGKSGAYRASAGARP